MTSLTTCRICGGKLDAAAAEHTGRLCTACIVLAGHVVSMTRDYPPLLWPETVATCQCGWQTRAPVAPGDPLREPIIAHWRASVTRLSVSSS